MSWLYHELDPVTDGPRLALVAALAAGDPPPALEACARRWEGMAGPSSLSCRKTPRRQRPPSGLRERGRP